jgi:DNA-binding response OmpR family regulator
LKLADISSEFRATVGVQMTQQQQLDAIRSVLSKLAETQMTTAICLSQLQDLVAIDAATPDRGKKRMLRVDDDTFRIVSGKRSCYLGRTKLLKLFNRLLRRANHFVSYSYLLRDVWDGDVRSPDTVRSAVRELKKKLIRARMRRVARCIRGQGQHYGLILSAW